MERTLNGPQTPEVITMKISFIFLGIMSLSIAQDYLQSSLFGFGFYWSEVVLFNIKWLLYLPVVWFAINLSNKGYHLLFLYAVSVAVGHAMINAFFISLVSTILMDHHFEFLALFKDSLGSEILLPFIAFWITIFMRKAFLTSESLKDIQGKVLKDSVTIRHRDEMLVIRDFDIKWVGREDQTTIIYSRSGKFVFPGSLTKIASKFDTLIRIHRSTLVNPNQIDRFRSRNNGDYDVFMKDGSTLRLSRRYRDAVLTLMNGKR